MSVIKVNLFGLMNSHIQANCFCNGGKFGNKSKNREYKNYNIKK